MGKVIANAREFVKTCDEFFPEYPEAIVRSYEALHDSMEAHLKSLDSSPEK